MKWAREMADDELREEYNRIGDVCDDMERAAEEGEEFGGGSPFEGPYDRFDECERELNRRGLI